MKIYTKKGDKGETQLLGGTQVQKKHIKLEAYGTIDELNAYIGNLYDQEIAQNHKLILFNIQNHLFKLGCNIASDGSKQQMDNPKIILSDVEMLEKEIDKLEKKLTPLNVFILPSGHHISSLCHIVRTVCRRAERRMVALNNKELLDENCLQYINRLSDYLFVLSRTILREKKIIENRWE